MSFILSIDQGTSGTKALIFDAAGQPVAKGSAVLQTAYFGDGFVEQGPEDIYANVLLSVEECLQSFAGKGYNKNDIAAIGISNQRETFVVWNEQGAPLCPAVVWQCKRSVNICRHLNEQGFAEIVSQKTGLIIDPYFSATKLVWLVQHKPEIKKAVENGTARFGTIDSWLLYKLTNGASYITDYTNASRTLLFNIHSLSWDEELIKIFGLQHICLPEAQCSAGYFGETSLDGLLPKAIPVTGMMGDSHAATFGEGCFDPGTAKATLGTGSSIMMNTGATPVASKNGMVATICWSLPGRVDYALEGVIVTCGATLEWLKNELQLFTDVGMTADMAQAVEDNGGVYFIPAFSGLGSPHWQMNRKAAITGMTFGTNKNHIVRAALESVPYQIKDVIAAMEKDTSLPLKQLMVNGGLTANKFVMQLLTDVLDKPVSGSTMPDVSALGAAYMAGLGCGLFKDIDALRHLPGHQKILLPSDNREQVQQWYKGWTDTIKHTYHET